MNGDTREVRSGGGFADLSKVPRELVLRSQWVVWKAALRNGKSTKLPVNAMTGRLASIDNSTNWTDYAVAVRAVDRFNCEGVGFVFTDSDPYSGIDLDDCRDPQTGEMQPWVRIPAKEIAHPDLMSIKIEASSRWTVIR